MVCFAFPLTSGERQSPTAGGYNIRTHDQVTVNTWNSNGAPPRKPGVTGLERPSPEIRDPAVMKAQRTRLGDAGLVTASADVRIEIPDPCGTAFHLQRI